MRVITSRRTPGGALSRRHFRLGLIFFGAVVVLGAIVLGKPALITFLTPGETIIAEFPKNLELQVGGSDVKIAGTKVGTVSSVDVTDGSKTVVSMKVDFGTRDKLGTDPTAAIRPVTILGGRYYISLAPGGGRGTYEGDVIPLARTSAPVELPEVLSALQPSARQGLQATVRDLDDTLGAGGTEALQALAQDAPGTLAPAGDVLNAAQGADPGTDLQTLVTNLDRIASVTTAHDGQIQSVLDKLQGTTQAVDAGSRELGTAVGGLPDTLRSTRTGMADLAVTLDKLKATAPDARPTVQELDRALDHLGPVLAAARPLVADLRPLLADARPTVDELVPTSQIGTAVLDGVKGAPLDRLNGPIISRVNEKWKGQDGTDFAGGGGNGRTTYQELGVLASRFANLSKFYDQNGAFANLQAGVGSNSLAGTPGLDRFLLDLTKIGGAPR